MAQAFPRHVGAVVAALAVTAAAVASAQDGPVAPNRAPMAGGSTTYLLFRTNAGMTAGRLKEPLSAACELADPNFDAGNGVRIEERNAAVLEQIRYLVEQADSLHGLGGGGPAVAPLPIEGNLWQVRLERPTQILEELTLTDAAGKEVTLKPAAPTQEAERLRMIVPGIYAVRIDPDNRPVSYRMTVGDLKSDKPIEKKGEWPASDRLFVATLKGFKGSVSDVYKYMQDKRVGNKVEQLESLGDLQFAFAAIQAGGAQVDDGFGQEGNEYFYIPRQPNLTDRQVSKVWMLFPLDKAAALAEFERLRGMSGSQVIEAVDAAATPASAEAITVSPDQPPQWVELPRSQFSGGFERRIGLDDIAGWQKRFPDLWRLVVWEFQGEGNGRRTALIVNQGPDVPLAGQSFPLRVEQAPNWTSRIGGIKPKPADATEKANPAGNATR